MRRATLAVTAVGPVVWGTSYIVTTEMLPPGDPLWAGVWRALPAGLVALALARRLPTGDWWWKAAALGLLNIGAFFPLLFFAADRLPGGVAAVLQSTVPLLVAVLAYVVLRVTPTVRQVVWGFVGLVGIGMVVIRHDVAADPAGVVAVLLSAVCVALAAVLVQKWGTPDSLLALTAWQLVVGGVAQVPLAAIAEGAPLAVDGTALLGFAWMGLVGGIVAYYVWTRGLERLPSSDVSFLLLLAPIVAALLGWVVLDQSFGVVQAVGFVLALASLVLAQSREERPAVHPSG